MIRNKCASSWNSNFDLFGGTDETTGTIKVYNYICRGEPQRSSNLFLNSQTPETCELRSPGLVFLPGNTYCIAIKLCIILY